MLIVPVVVVGLALSACGGSSSGSFDTAAPSANGSMNDRSKNGIKGSTSSDSAPLSADQADQKAQDRCRELEAKDSIPEAVVEALRIQGWRRYPELLSEMLRTRSLGLGKTACVGERQGGEICDPTEHYEVAFQRAKVNGEAEVLRCRAGSNGAFFWLRIEAFPGS
jgi:hypothetical protein